MILKTLDYRTAADGVGAVEEWNYFDNITSAGCYFDEITKMPCVRCNFRDGNYVVIAVPNVAYLMSDTGKTIEKIVPADVEELGDGENAIYARLQDAVDEAKDR